MQTYPDISFAIGEQRDYAVLSEALRFPTMILITDENAVFPVETQQPIAFRGKPKGVMLVLNRCRYSSG
jgi:hypothetical protein